jgi:hypothetical protein
MCYEHDYSHVANAETLDLSLPIKPCSMLESGVVIHSPIASDDTQPLVGAFAIPSPTTSDDTQTPNTGVEIPATEYERIFAKFYRIPNSDPWKHGGTGLGLALTKKLTESLGGQIHVESGGGQTTFVLTFGSSSAAGAEV